MENKFYVKFLEDNISIVVQSPDEYLVLDYTVGHKKIIRTIQTLSEFDLAGYDLSKPRETNIMIQTLNNKSYEN